MPEIDSNFSRAGAEGRLAMQQCTECATLRFPPANSCPNCLSFNDEWVDLSGRGVIWSWIRMHRQYFTDERRTTPYNVVMVQLEEGPRLISAIEDEDADFAVGRPVRAVFHDDGQRVLPWFRLADQDA